MPRAWAQRPGKSMPWGLAGREEGTQGTDRGSLLLGQELGLRGVPPVGGQRRRERLPCWQCLSGVEKTVVL